MADVRAAVETGIDGVNIYMATSPILAKHSHGKGIDEVIGVASEVRAASLVCNRRAAPRQVIKYVLSHGLEVRFSCEDAFRSNLEDILRIYAAVRPQLAPATAELTEGARRWTSSACTASASPTPLESVRPQQAAARELTAAQPRRGRSRRS
jgi:hypothetical protein